MAKVESPLFSLSASGKVGDAIVFFTWKGKNVVRQWLKPANPQSTLQGFVRCSMKAISKWIAAVQNTNSGNTVDSVIYQAATASVTSGLNWNAYLAQGLLNNLQSAGEYATASFNALVAEYSTSLASSVRAAFEALGSTLGMAAFVYDYGYTTSIPAGLQLYFGAKACYNQGIIGTAEYSVDPVSWDTASVSAFYSNHIA